jgi:hypothetical protein
MTDQPTDPETAIIPAEPPDLTLAEYGSRDDVAALARRIKTLMPGGDKLSLAQAMAAAQYAILLDANIYRGEVYAWVDKRGQLVLEDGYKLLVRWAKDHCNYHAPTNPSTACPQATSASPATSSATTPAPSSNRSSTPAPTFRLPSTSPLTPPSASSAAARCGRANTTNP